MAMLRSGTASPAPWRGQRRCCAAKEVKRSHGSQPCRAPHGVVDRVYDYLRELLRAVDLELLRAVDLELLRAVDLRAVDLRAVDLRAVDLRAVDLRAVDLRAVESKREQKFFTECDLCFLLDLPVRS